MPKKVPAFEVILDHTDERHHERMAQLLPQLQAWAAQHGVRHVQREETEIRPGVVRLRFTPDLKAAREATQKGRDSLALSPDRPAPKPKPGQRPQPGDDRPKRPSSQLSARRPASMPGRSIQR